MQLNRLTERVWVYPFEEERDRPNLGYVRGDRWSLAVDAGHSAAHVREFYAALQAAGLPLPSLTVLTHWHWDHAFGMHAVHGLCLAGERTNRHLADFRSRPGAKQELLSAEERVRREYADGQPMIVTQADLTLNREMRLETGGCSVRVFPAAAPHTDDSTLIYLPDEKVLFLGDAACGALPDWKKDPALCRRLADTIDRTGADIVLEGHWTPLSRQEQVRDLLSDAEQAEKTARDSF